MTELFRLVPAGVGASGFVRLDRSSFEQVMIDGARWCIEQGFGCIAIWRQLKKKDA
jgi:tRNA-splicing ligase RtcB